MGFFHHSLARPKLFAHTDFSVVQKIIRHRIAILLSLISWAAFGAATNSSDLNFYGLYQVGAESLVEYHTYPIGHSIVPGWKDAGDGDIFVYQGQRFPAKQPGAFFATAVPYFFLHSFFGLNFLKNQDWVAALNSWLSVGVVASIAVGVFYETLMLLGFGLSNSLITTLTFTFGTLFFPYTGIPHHDIFAVSCLIFGFFYLLRGKFGHLAADFRSAGAWIGLTLFFSMLPALLVAAISIYGLTLTRSTKNRIHLLIGLITGYLPLALFNAYYFGNPFTQANMAGNYRDTFFKLSLATMKEHFHDYFGVTSYLSILQMMPVFALGMIGLFLLSKRYRKEKLLLISMLILHVGYLLNISTIGHCQFGPRYLIPLIPFMMIGFAGWMRLHGKWLSPITKTLGALTILYSFAVNLMGAIGDTMYCGNLVESPIHQYWNNRKAILADHFWIAPYSVGVLVLAIIFFIWVRNQLPVNRRFSEST